jgi:hypothetical protein
MQSIGELALTAKYSIAKTQEHDGLQYHDKWLRGTSKHAKQAGALSSGGHDTQTPPPAFPDFKQQHTHTHTRIIKRHTLL